MDKNKEAKKQEEVIEPEEVQEEEMTESPELEKAQMEAVEYKNRYLRALADYQNLEKRMREERMEIGKIAQANVIGRLFPVLDNLNQAEVFIKDPGLKMIKDMFNQTLAELGVKEIELMGKEYDPHFAEVIDVVEGETDNIIVEVLHKGYELNGKVLRPGQVRVSKKK